MRHLTGLPINYVITVDFHGFKKVVELARRRVAGRRPALLQQEHAGVASTDFANINLQPGYQRLTGGAALEFVRFRHTDSDLYRLARQQEFVRGVKAAGRRGTVEHEQIPNIVNDIVENIEVAPAGTS